MKFVPTPESNYVPMVCGELINLDWFADWVIGFTMAEGSFYFKAKGGAFFSIRQKGLVNFEIIKAICILVANRPCRPIKADTGDNYKLELSSVADINRVLLFFSSPTSNLHPLMGYKLIQYNDWLTKLQTLPRYFSLPFFCQ